MKEIMKKIAIAILIVIGLLLATCEPEDPYYSEWHTIPQKVCAKGKPLRVKKKTLKQEYESLGEYTLTAYCNCAKCCGKAGGKTASGTIPKSKHTIAADTKLLPYGTVVFIKGQRYVVEDCGSAVKGKHIDVFFDTHSEALRFGTRKAEVYKRKSPQLLFKIKVAKIERLKDITRKEIVRFGSYFRSRKLKAKS